MRRQNKMCDLFRIGVAGLKMELVCRYPYTRALCRDYLLPDGPVDQRLSASEEEIQRELDAGVSSDLGYCESICLLRQLTELLWAHDTFLVHAAAIAMDGRAYLFAAMSGTGKSTHIRQWGRRFGRRVTVINGDKPLLRLGADGVFRVCGSPWCGKEGWQTNTEAPLAGICFLERAETDFIEPMDNRAVLQKLFLQVVVPEQDEHVDACFTLLDRLVSTVPCYRLGCTISPHAAEVAWRGMNPQEETV